MAKQTNAHVAVVVWSHRVGALRVGDEGNVIGIDFLPGAFTALGALVNEGFSLQFVLPGSEARAHGGDLEEFFPAGWKVRAVSARDVQRTLGELVTAAPAADLLIASDREHRGVGGKKGIPAWPDAESALLAVQRGGVLCVRLEGDVPSLQSEREFLPYFLERQRSGRWMGIGLITRGALARCITRWWKVAVLPVDPRVEDLLLVHLDETNATTVDALAHINVVFSEGRRLLVAVGLGVANDAIGIHGAHGHYIALWPDRLLWDRSPQDGRFDSVEVAFANLAQSQIKIELPRIDVNVLKLLTTTCPATATQFQADLDRYTGVAALDTAGPIVSRHYRHADNARAVDRLMADLQAMGYCPYRHAFEYNGRTLHNVIADLPGRGRFVLPPGHLGRSCERSSFAIPYPILLIRGFARLGRFLAGSGSRPPRGANVLRSNCVGPWNESSCCSRGISGGENSAHCTAPVRRAVVVGCHLRFDSELHARGTTR